MAEVFLEEWLPKFDQISFLFKLNLTMSSLCLKIYEDKTKYSKGYLYSKVALWLVWWPLMKRSCQNHNLSNNEGICL